MALILLKENYTRGNFYDFRGQGFPTPSNPYQGTAGYYWHRDKWEFDTATELVTHTYTENYYGQQTAPVNSQAPSNFNSTGVFHSKCLPNTTTLREFTHNGNGGFTTADTLNSTVCGYKPEGEFIRTQCFGFDLFNMVSDGQGGEKKGTLVEANSASCNYVPPVCDLVANAPLVIGKSVRLSASTSFPPVQYSLDGGEFSEIDFYEDLADGAHTVAYKDANPRNCTANSLFSIGDNVDKLNYSRTPFYQQIPAAAGLAVEAELWVETEHFKGDFRKVITWRKTATLDGFCHFRLDSVLGRLVQPEVPAAAGTAACKKNILNYFVRYRVANGAWQNTLTSTVLLGGLPAGQELSPFGHFLTSHPLVKTVHHAQPEYLYWISDGTHQEVHVLRIKYFDNDLPQSHTLEAVEQVKKHQLLCIPAFVGSMANVSRVEVQLLDSSFQPIFPKTAYKVDQAAPETDRFFFFSNSWGGCDTLRCTGEREEITDMKEEVGEVDVLPGQHALDAFMFVISQMLDLKIKQSTGANPEWRQQYLQDFIFSPARYEILPGRGFAPIILTKRALSYQVGESRQGYTFEFKYAFDPIGYARIY